MRKRKTTDYRMDDFDAFWRAWPRKIAKANAVKAWRNHIGNVPDIETLLQIVALHATSAQWQKDGGQFIPHPATWINAERWADEVEPYNNSGYPPGYKQISNEEADRLIWGERRLDEAAEATR